MYARTSLVGALRNLVLSPSTEEWARQEDKLLLVCSETGFVWGRRGRESNPQVPARHRDLRNHWACLVPNLSTQKTGGDEGILTPQHSWDGPPKAYPSLAARITVLGVHTRS